MHMNAFHPDDPDLALGLMNELLLGFPKARNRIGAAVRCCGGISAPHGITNSTPRTHFKLRWRPRNQL